MRRSSSRRGTSLRIEITSEGLDTAAGGLLDQRGRHALEGALALYTLELMSDFDARLAADPVHNELEQALVDGIRGTVRQTVFISAFLITPVFALSRAEASADSMEGFSPLILSTEAGAPMLPLFTDLSRVPSDYRESAPHAVALNGGRFVASLADEVGIVVNPGHPIGFELSPGALAAIRRDFAESQQD